MNSKIEERQKAVDLRKKGHTYNEILKEVSVAKSSLSLWLKDLPLTNREKRYLKTRTDSNISYGRIKAATANRERRLTREKLLFKEAKKEFEVFVKDPLFHTGVALYWAEGVKRSNSFAFSNSDPEMVITMIFWIEKFLGVNRVNIRAKLYAHSAYAHENIEQFWGEKLGIPVENFNKTTIKPSVFKHRKRPSYKGCIRISIQNGTNNLKRFLFWKRMLVEYYYPK